MFSLKRKVLLISEHPVVREGLALLISRETDLDAWASVAQGRSGLQAMEVLKPDIVVIHLAFDAKRGIELIEEISTGSPRMPVLVFSVHDNAIYAEHALRAGARGYVLQQEDTSTVIDAIRQVLNGKTYVSKGVSTTLLERFIDVLSGVGDTGSIHRLSNRELVVLQQIGEGMTTKQIAGRLCVSIKTIETYRTRIKTKLNIKAHPDLIQYAIRWARSFYQA
jgi:DNA-binding NarL/FixJ family response regulator